MELVPFRERMKQMLGDEYGNFLKAMTGAFPGTAPESSEEDRQGGISG